MNKIIVTPLFFPKLYFYWVHLCVLIPPFLVLQTNGYISGLEVLTTIFWMTSFALLADELKWWNIQQKSIDYVKANDGYDFDFDFNYKAKRADLNGNIDAQEAAIGASRAATGLAAINWILFCVTLVVLGMFIHKHRLADGSGGSGFGGARKTNDVEVAGQQEKVVHNQPVELRNVQQHQYAQYPQQPAPAH